MGSDAWKNHERAIAKALGGERVLRGSNFSVIDVDVKIPDFPHLIVDGKFRQRWSHHRFLKEVRDKYCNSPEDVPILVTKHSRQRGAVVCLPLEAFGKMLDEIRELKNK